MKGLGHDEMNEENREWEMKKAAVLIIDMLNDFVTGSLGCPRAQAAVQGVVELADAARACGVPVVFCNDAHVAGVDRELSVWGDHAIAGTFGAQLIPELGFREGDFVVPKRRYSSFFQTDLDILLRELGVDTVVVAGLHTDACVRHTSADAFCLGYDVVVAKDATDSLTERDYLAGLEYLRKYYGAAVLSNEELKMRFAHASSRGELKVSPCGDARFFEGVVAQLGSA